RWACAPDPTAPCPSAASPCPRASRPGICPSTNTWWNGRARDEPRRPPPASARTSPTAARSPAPRRAPVLVDAAGDGPGGDHDVLRDGRLAGDEDRPGRGPPQPGAARRLPGRQPLPPQGGGRG